MKKTIKGIGILVVALCLSLTMFACGDKDGKDGVAPIAVQKAASADAETALRAYVADELAYAVESTDWDSETQQEVIVMRDIVLAEYVGSEAKGEAKLKLSETDAKDLVSAEKYAVKAKVAPAPEDDGAPAYEEVTQTVYVLKYGETSYKYAIAEPVTGERITNSYYAMITAAKNYANCTFVSTTKGKDPDETAVTFQSGIEMKSDANALYSVLYGDEGRFTARTPICNADDSDEASYCVKTKDGLVGVALIYDDTEQKASWRTETMEDEGDLIDIIGASLNEAVFAAIEAPALLAKTKDGAQYHATVTETRQGSTMERKNDVTVTIEDGKITAIAYEMKITGTEDGTAFTMEYGSTMTFSDFGKTTVTVPKEVTDAIDAAKAQTPAA